MQQCRINVAAKYHHITESAVAVFFIISRIIVCHFFSLALEPARTYTLPEHTPSSPILSFILNGFIDAAPTPSSPTPRSARFAIKHELTFFLRNNGAINVAVLGIHLGSSRPGIHHVVGHQLQPYNYCEPNATD